MKKYRVIFLSILMTVLLCVSGYTSFDSVGNNAELSINAKDTILSDIPEFSGSPYIVVNGNEPYFTEQDHTTTSFEEYSELDHLGRCGVTYANIGQDIMPTQARGSIGQVKPSGWHTIKYDCVNGNYLYNRCHLIGYQLSGENANVKNLITGTRYLNVEGMLPFENLVADYVKETGNHVLYRVTPIFEGDNLVASGVLMEALSVEDKGEGICYNIYVYNNQPSVIINYATGESSLAENETEHEIAEAPKLPIEEQEEYDYILNISTKKIHYPTCSSVNSMVEKNKEAYAGDKEALIQLGYTSCGRCKP